MRLVKSTPSRAAWIATALLCGIEVSAVARADELERVFVGVPNRLSLPPNFPQEASPAVDNEGCPRIAGPDMQQTEGLSAASDALCADEATGPDTDHGTSQPPEAEPHDVTATPARPARDSNKRP